MPRAKKKRTEERSVNIRTPIPQSLYDRLVEFQSEERRRLGRFVPLHGIVQDVLRERFGGAR